jgi:uncharacterized protein YutE (UPF0331/DUF86 family)
MVRVEVIRNRLRGYRRSEFVGNPERYGSAERFLQLALEALTDMVSHVIADLNLGVVNWRSDIPVLLEEHGAIDAALRDRWIRMIGFRNVLAHDYLDIDRNIVYDVLQHNLEDLEALKRAFARFL